MNQHLARLGAPLFATAALYLSSCGGARSQGSEAPASSSEAAFDDLSLSEQKAFMQAVVVPAMTKIFKASPEPEHFPKVDCTTCHGQAAKSGNFEMPSPDLPKFATFEDAMKEHPKMTKYMAEVVVPEMAKLIQEEPFDPRTGQGFGCFDCHMKP